MAPHSAELGFLGVAHSGNCCSNLKIIQLCAGDLMKDLYGEFGDRQLFSHAGLKLKNSSPDKHIRCPHMIVGGVANKHPRHVVIV